MFKQKEPNLRVTNNGRYKRSGKCELLFGSCTHETILCVNDIKKVNKLQIPYFNGTNFDGLIKSKPSRVSKSSENDDGAKPF